MEIHHIQAIYLGGKTEMDNLITLCSDCHMYAPDTTDEFNNYISSPEIFKMMALWNSCKDKLSQTVAEVEVSNVQGYYINGLISKESMELILEHICNKLL